MVDGAALLSAAAGSAAAGLVPPGADAALDRAAPAKRTGSPKWQPEQAGSARQGRRHSAGRCTSGSGSGLAGGCAAGARPGHGSRRPNIGSHRGSHRGSEVGAPVSQCSSLVQPLAACPQPWAGAPDIPTAAPVSSSGCRAQPAVMPHAEPAVPSRQLLLIQTYRLAVRVCCAQHWPGSGRRPSRCEPGEAADGDSSEQQLQ